MAGSAVIGSLRVNLGMDSAEFQSGARKAQGTLSALGGSIKAFAVGALSALSLGSVTAALKSAVNHMDELGKAAQKIGIPVEQLSGLEYAARLADVSLGDLQGSLSKFNKALGEIAAGKENSASAALKAIGVSALDTNGKLRPTSDLIADIAEKFAGYSDGAEKAALAQALFGKSGADMIPLLNAGREGLAQANAEAERFGLLVGKDAAAAAEQFNDNLTRLQGAGQGLTQIIAGALLPALADLGDKLLSYIDIGSHADDITAALQAQIAEITKYVMVSAAEIEKLGVVWSTVTNIFSGNTGPMGAVGALRQMQAEIARINSDLEKQISLSTQLSNLSGKGSLPPPASKPSAPIIIDPSGLDKTTKSIKALKAEATLAGASLYDALIPGLVETGEAASESANQIGTTLANSFQSWIGDAVDGTFRLKDALNDLLSQLTKLALNGLLQNLLGGGGSLYGANPTGIFGGMFAGAFAGGGQIPAGKFGLVGEGGGMRHAEIVTGPANVTPLSKLGGRGIEVNVFNNSQSKVEPRENDRGGLDFFINDALESKLPGMLNKLMPVQFGQKPLNRRR